jgi:hypothetical protein
MKSQNLDFFRQMFSVVIGTLLFVATVGFLTLPMSMGCSQGAQSACTASLSDWHLT